MGSHGFTNKALLTSAKLFAGPFFAATSGLSRRGLDSGHPPWGPARGGLCPRTAWKGARGEGERVPRMGPPTTHPPPFRAQPPNQASFQSGLGFFSPFNSLPQPRPGCACSWEKRLTWCLWLSPLIQGVT